jgi:hypothetical protein
LWRLARHKIRFDRSFPYAHRHRFRPYALCLSILIKNNTLLKIRGPNVRKKVGEQLSNGQKPIPNYPAKRFRQKTWRTQKTRKHGGQAIPKYFLLFGAVRHGESSTAGGIIILVPWCLGG